MIKVNIADSEHDALLNIRAAKIYHEITGHDMSKMGEVTDAGAFIYACIEAAYRWKKSPNPITLDDVYDRVELSEMATILLQLLPQKKEGE